MNPVAVRGRAPGSTRQTEGTPRIWPDNTVPATCHTARFTLAARNGGLVLLRRRTEDVCLEATSVDAFDIAQFDFEFARDARGAVARFDIFAERVRYLRFERER